VEPVDGPRRHFLAKDFAMSLRRAAVAALASLTALIVISPGAYGAPVSEEPVICTILDTSPDVIVLGVTPKSVQFDVSTDCDDKYAVSWSVRAENYRGSAHVSWLAVCNYHRPADASVFDCAHDGSTTMNMVGTGDWAGNDMAGTTHPLYSYAFYDADGDNFADHGESSDQFTGEFTLLRETTFGSSFDASPASHRRGHKVTFTGQVQRANWDTGQFENYSTWLTLQFRPAGARHFRDVKQVWDDGDSATTTVRATRSGSWRYHVDASSTEAAGNSRSEYVRVR
jgi:hypothetical protein